MLVSLFNKVADLQLVTLLKKRLQHRCFPVIIAKSLRTSILQNMCKWGLSKAVIQKCSAKKVFLEVSQNSQENICARIFFLKKLQV